MRHHPFFYVALLALQAARIPALDTYLSGDWVDFTTFETKAELRSEEAAGKNRLSVRGLFIDRHSAVQENKVSGGGELRRTGDSVLIIAGGPLKAAGLPYALTSPFGKALHTGARLALSSYSLDTNAAVTKPPAAALAIGGGRGEAAMFRFTAAADSSDRGTGVAAFGLGAGKNLSGTFEAFLTHATIAGRTCGAWFSEEPPLPPRRHTVGALALTVNAAGSQWFLGGAYSDTEAQGSGGYFKAIADAEFGRFRFVVGADAATARFIDAAGDPTGQKIRGILHLRYTGPGGGALLIRAESVFDGMSAAPKEATLDGSYRFAPADSPEFFRLTEASWEAAKAPPEAENPGYRFMAGARLGLGPVMTSFGASLRTSEQAGREECGFTAKTVFSIWKTSVSLSAGAVADKYWKPRWTAALGAAASVKGGLIMARLGTDAPTPWDRLAGSGPSTSPLGPWNFSLSWRFRERFQPGPLVVE